MVRQIECPVCETEFEVSSRNSEPDLTCPACERTFPRNAALLASAVVNQPPPLPTTSPVKSKPQSSSTSLGTPAPELVQGAELETSRGPDPANPATLTEEPPVAQPAPASLVQVRQRYRQRNRKRTVLTIAAAFVFAMIILALTIVFLRQVQGLDFASNPDQQDSGTATLDAPTDGSASDPTPPLSVARETVKEPTAPIPSAAEKFKNLPPQKFQFLSREDVADVWQDVQPRLVSLTVFDNTGSHQAVGTVIDSRGWLLTSYLAIAGANKIEIRAAAKSAEELDRNDLLRDEVRGTIAVKPDLDIAILSVNRRFVTTFGGLEWSDASDGVNGQYLIQAAPPSLSNLYGVEEVQVTGSVRDDAVAQRIRERNANADPEIPLVELERKASPLPGTPVFNSKGKLTGVISFAADQHSYCVPIWEIEPTINQAVDVVSPLPQAELARANETGPAAVAVSHPMREISVRLNQLGEACDAFGWIASTEDEYLQLQRFTGQMTEVLNYTIQKKGNEAEAAELRKMEQQVERWREAISRQIASPSPEQRGRMFKMNELAARQLNKGDLNGDEQFVPCFGKVAIAGIVSPDPEAMFLSIGDDLAYAKVPFDPSGTAMLPYSRWLFFLKRYPTRRRIRYEYSGKRFESVNAQMLFAIGPLE